MPTPFRTYAALGGLLLTAACQRAAYPAATTTALPPAEPAMPAPVVTTGVAHELAEYRKQTISRVAYALHLTVPASKADPVQAEEIVSFRLRDNRNPVQLDFKGQASQLHSLSINGQPAAIDYRQEHLVLPAASLRVGDNAIEISLNAGDLSLNRNADYLYTLLVPDRARTVVPVFDQPNLKATITLLLTMPGAWQPQAVANGTLREIISPSGNGLLPYMISYAFAPSDSISTYLFSFAAGRFTHLRQQVGGREMNFYHRETDSTKIRLSMPTIFRLHGEALSFLESYTGLPYPFQKFDFTAIPDFQYGGMEHVGNIDYKASSLFLDEGATKDQLLARQNLIGHETAHMWFGDLVTMQWFNDVWMKEVFANFMADKMNPEAAAGPAQLLKFVTDHYPAAYAVDRTTGANPIRQPLENLQDAGSLYGNIIYHKAPIMMRQLERLMGEKPFQEGVQEYLKKYAHSNATWPDLITILDAHTPADLAAWNQVWVNQPGRPVFDYEVQPATNQLVIRQHAEDGSDRLWPQQFEVLAVYPSGPVEIPVNMSQREVRVPLPAGQPAPSYVLLNSQGLGYGVFPVAPAAADHLATLADPVARASTYIALYENMLAGRGLAPRPLLDRYLAQTAHETNDLNIKLLTGQLSDIFWKFLPPAERVALAPAMERALWQAMQKQPRSGEQKLYFKAYQSIALTPGAQKRLYQIWQSQQAPGLVKLTEDDYTSLALALAVRDYAAPQPILPQQLARITNVDRRQRLQFMMPALSPEVAVRDQFFASLKDEKNREKEAWVTAALGYLHHPLRQATSEKYLPESLNLLAEIQLTGDIFFPASWLQSTLGYYQSPAAAQVVRAFLAAHPTPGYNPQLRAKLLQAADDLLRAEKLAL